MASKEFFDFVSENKSVYLAWCFVLLPLIHAVWIFSAFTVQNILAHKRGLPWKSAIHQSTQGLIIGVSFYTFMSCLYFWDYGLLLMTGWFFVLMLTIYRKFFRIVEKGKEKRIIAGVFVIGLIIMLGFAIATVLDIVAF